MMSSRYPRRFLIGFITGLCFTPYAFAQDFFGEKQGNTVMATENIKAETPEDDAAITNTMKNVIKHSKTLSDLDVKVTTKKGVVMLEGTVDSDTDASVLIQNAEAIIGVRNVDTSNLKVKDSEQPFADMVTTAKIKGLFIREKLFGEKDIAAINTTVETKNGVVHLSGVVDNPEQIHNAVEIIKKYMPDVKKIEYNVRKTVPAKE